MNEERSVSFNINFGIGLGTVIYLAIGLFFYAVWYMPEVFTWNDPWLYIVVVLWPFAVMWEMMVILFYLALIVGFVAILAYGYIWIEETIRDKKAQAIRKKRGK